MCDNDGGRDSCQHDHGASVCQSGRGDRQTATTRRAMLAGGVGLAVGLAGCQANLLGEGTEETVPDPVTLSTDDACDVCGMIIPNHDGPNAQVFYADQQPSGHDNPARFCSTWEAFQYDFGRRDWERQVFYVTDYSTVDYDLFTDAGQTHISSHPGADAFVDATAVTFVVGSEVVGAMGEDLLGFSTAADAERFQNDHGGDVLAFDEVTEATIAELANR